MFEIQVVLSVRTQSNLEGWSDPLKRVGSINLAGFPIYLL